MNSIFSKIVLCGAAVVLLAGCELFVFGTKRSPIIEISQKSSLGAVLLFKAELDSNNTMAATEILAGKDGRKLLAIEKRDMVDEIARIGRLISKKPITRLFADTLTPDKHSVLLELNYLKKMTFSTLRINSAWYITDIQE
ncbi:hypothetical protein MASR2M18_17340 [Ignavibacteria bacterium]|nr:hypothetical protein [Bacteroidota bacterium]MCZ2132009.1 hypothetical protein [Bacteroidota bacterium]